MRKHLSAIHGGRLAAASRAPVVALIISDVTGDDPTHIASGPVRARSDDVRRCARDPRRATASSRRPVNALECADETPKPGDPVFAHVQNKVIATAHRSLEAAARGFRAAAACSR